MKTVRQEVKAIGLVVLSLAVVLSCTGAYAAKYPSKPIDIIVPFAPGGGSDSAGRLIADYAQKTWRVQVNVINKPGGSGVTGTLEVMNSRPDGYTLLSDAHSSSSMMAGVQKSLPFDPSNRTYLGQFGTYTPFFVVGADSPWKTLKEVVEEAKKDPKAFKWACGALGGMDNFSITRFFQVAGVDANAGRVIFQQGHAQAMAALLGGHVKFGTAEENEVKSLDGIKIRTVGVAAAQRDPGFPHIPTARESGYAVDISGWRGLAGPPGLPKDVITAWGELIARAGKDPAFQALAKKLGVPLEHMNGPGLADRVKKEVQIYTDIAKSSGLR